MHSLLRSRHQESWRSRRQASKCSRRRPFAEERRIDIKVQASAPLKVSRKRVHLGPVHHDGTMFSEGNLKHRFQGSLRLQYFEHWGKPASRGAPDAKVNALVNFAGDPVAGYVPGLLPRDNLRSAHPRAYLCCPSRPGVCKRPAELNGTSKGGYITHHDSSMLDPEPLIPGIRERREGNCDSRWEPRRAHSPLPFVSSASHPR